MTKYEISRTTLINLLKEKLITEELNLLPSGWEILGDILIIRLNPKLNEKRNLIGQAFLEMYGPRIRSAVQQLKIVGDIREQKIEVLAGDSNTETIHRELGCKFKIDPAKLMFSFGNHYERKRMAFISNPNETVIDMFAGVGQFCIPMAVHSKPKKVFGIEINPVTFHYLSENIKLNRLEYVMTPILGDCREVELAKADRIIMGYLRNTEQFLPKAFELVKPSGIIHYHEVSPAKFLFEQPINHIESITTATGKKIKILEKRMIKEYSPGTYHVVVDFQVRE
ncbi:MAG: class I SAM-dependent methyltransferase family protein [Euryarchaeota archaeon]|nr:class I SAM-dependent methyltransferase family protein [Euryarchaeota archaeon]